MPLILHQTAVSSIDRALRAGISSQTTWDIARLYRDAILLLIVMKEYKKLKQTGFITAS
jgi:hypothetical protein